MKEKIEALSNEELIQVSEELRLVELPENAIARRLIEPGAIFAMSIIKINCYMVQVLADRLIICNKK
jgi:hypothetical protein